MPTTATARPALRLHRPPGCPDPPPWSARSNPTRPAPSAEDVPWHRYGRLPNGAAPGCTIDLAIYRGRPPAGIVAHWDPSSRVWVSIRVVDPIAGYAVDG